VKPVDDGPRLLDRRGAVGLFDGSFSHAAFCLQEASSMPASASISIATDQLRSIVERIERLEEEKQALADDIKEVYAEAKGNGYDTTTLRAVVRLRKQDSSERQEREALLDLYMSALGMITAEAAE
jgi:uncharacterized protein (UPF0335 family)